MKTVTFKLPEELGARISAAARRSRRSRSELVRQALEAWVARPRGRQAGSCLDLIGDLVGSVAGPRDLSTNRRHLKGFGR